MNYKKMGNEVQSSLSTINQYCQNCQIDDFLRLKTEKPWFMIVYYMEGTMTRKIIGFSCILLILILLVSCAGTKGLSATSDSSSAVYSGIREEKPIYTYNVLDEKYQNPDGVYTIPWRENAVEIAKQTNTIRYYFMSSEKQIIAEKTGPKFGDSCLIVFPDGTTMLVDGGMSGYTATLMKNLELLGIEKLDYVLLSHMHDDHYGALWSSAGVMRNIPIDTFIWSGCYNTTDGIDARLKGILSSNGIKEVIVQQGDSMQIGEALLEFFWPVTEEVIGKFLQETTLNNNSIVMKITFGDFKALFCGDLYSDGEYRVLANNEEGVFDVDLVKANHHGRDTSNSKEWCAATTPRAVVGTSGNPMDSTPYGWYSKIGARVFCDSLDGYVRVVSDGYNCELTTSRPRTTNMFENFDKLAEQVLASM